MHGYTVLRLLDDATIPLLRWHRERLGVDSGPALEAFATSAAPGVYRVAWDGARLDATSRGRSRLRDGMPTRSRVSPFAGRTGRFPKPAPPSPYEAVRLDGVATLLTDEGGTRLLESCAASLVSWDGTTFIVTPESSPSVASVAERAVLEHLSPRREVLPVDSDAPLLLINAVAGTCAIDCPGRRPFPPNARARLEALLVREDA